MISVVDLTSVIEVIKVVFGLLSADGVTSFAWMILTADDAKYR